MVFQGTRVQPARAAVPVSARFRRRRMAFSPNRLASASQALRQVTWQNR